MSLLETLLYGIRRGRHAAVTWSLLATALRMGGFLLVLPLVLRVIPKEQLGLWYTFAALAGVSALFDLGFSTTAVRAASYLWAGAPRLVAEGHEKAPEGVAQPNLEGLRRLVATMRLYYLFTAGAAFLVLSTVGTWWLLPKIQQFPNERSLLLAWLVFLAGGFLNSVGAVWPAMLSGLNAVRQAQQIFCLTLLVNYALVVVGLLSGMGLWALILGNLSMGFLATLLGRWWFQEIAGPRLRKLPWKLDREYLAVMWPNAWKSGVSALSGYLTVYANTLICTQRLDLATTASYALTLQVLQALSSISLVFLTVKLPVFNVLRVTHRSLDIARTFFTRLRVVQLVFLGGIIPLVLWGDPLMHLIGAKTPLLNREMLAIFALITFMDTSAVAFFYLQLTSNVNPFVLPGLISGSLIVLGCWFFAGTYGIFGMLLTVLIVQCSWTYWGMPLRALRSLPLSISSALRFYFTNRFCS